MSSIQFTSTRDPQRASTDFHSALRTGLAPDGGLYVPRSVPELPPLEARFDMASIGQAVLGRWIGSDAATDAAIADALNFPVRLVPLGGPWDGVHVLELFHGPTLSFKDFGARTMARLLASGRTAGTPLTILVATSGDTGSAVADGFSGIPGVRVVLLYPEGQVSPTQEKQLIVERRGVTALRVRGTFDDCQRMVKGAFADERLAGVPLSSANSINIGRLLPQMLYYIWAWLQLGDAARICVPSGNLGNLTAAVLAHLAGMPVRGFIAAHNANRFFPDYLAGSEDGFMDSVRTRSNAMDVGAPSNFERLEWLLGRERMSGLIQGASVDDAATLDRMREVYDSTGYLPDPHTAVGLEALARSRSEWAGRGPVLVASTAHPGKFPDAVQDALGFTPVEPEGLSRLRTLGTRVQSAEPTADALRSAILADLPSSA